MLVVAIIAGVFFVHPIFVFGEVGVGEEITSDTDITIITGESIVEGTGNRFVVTESSYLDVTLESSERITARLESMPEMLILELESAITTATTTQLTFSRLASTTTYYLYTDGYENGVSFTTDGAGSYEFAQDISTRHLLFIQPRKSTKILRDDATGGDCILIGDWDVAVKTCTLTTDVGESIQIKNNDITLDGNGHTIRGNGTGIGVYVQGNYAEYLTDVVIANLTIENFSIGINTRYVKNSMLANNVIRSNQSGIIIARGNELIVKDNAIANNSMYGVRFDFAKNTTLRNNAISGNTEMSLYLQQQLDEYYDQDIDASNTLNGKSIVYLVRARDMEYGAEDQVGIFYCIFCENVVLRDAEITDNNVGVFLWKSANVQVRDTVLSRNDYAVMAYYSNNNTFTNITADANSFRGFLFDHAKNNIVQESSITNGYIGIQLNTGSNGNTMKQNTITDNRYGTSLYDVADNTFTGNIFANEVGVQFSRGSGGNMFVQNDFSNGIQVHSIGTHFQFSNIYALPLPVGGNHWSDYDEHAEGCFDADANVVCDMSHEFSVGVDAFPWVTADVLPVPKNGHSSVAFLPGLQASRLYKKQESYGTEFENTLWEPNHNGDAEKLFMDKNGISIDPDIYTREVIDEANGFNIYLKFMLSMDKLVDDNVINEWKAFPYDWRMDYEDILRDGVVVGDGAATTTMNIVEELERLAADSASGKVTIIAHSHGGLLAKTLLRELEAQGKAELIDKLILVASPQLGTPKAVASLLHGDGQDLPKHIGVLLNKKNAREMGENMQSAYNLTPSREYFHVVNVTEQPMIVFDPSVSYISGFVVEYGDGISTFGDLYDFSVGARGTRTEPVANDTDTPNVLGVNFFDRAIEVHNDLDAWMPPAHIEITQIAGWGLDTVRGIEYSAKPWDRDLSHLDRKLLMTSDGDKTVVSPSATYMDAETFYVNLFDHNAEIFFGKRSHASILEVKPLQDLIKNIVEENIDTNTLPSHITTTKPVENKSRLRLAIHSPVSIDVTDSYGNQTGLVENTDPNSDLQGVEEQIPNSYYLQIGEHKYVGLDTRDNYTIELKGQRTGVFTFEIQEVLNDVEIATTTYVTIPVTASTTATLTLSTIASSTDMVLDINGDGITDFTLIQNSEPDVKMSLAILKQVIQSLDAEEKAKKKLIKKIQKVEKKLKKEKYESALDKTDDFMEDLEKMIGKHDDAHEDDEDEKEYENDDDKEKEDDHEHEKDDEKQDIIKEDAIYLLDIVRQVREQLLYYTHGSHKDD